MSECMYTERMLYDLKIDALRLVQENVYFCNQYPPGATWNTVTSFIGVRYISTYI